MNDIGEASYEERGLRSTGDDTEISSEPKNMSCRATPQGRSFHSQSRAWQARYICMGRTHSGKEHGGDQVEQRQVRRVGWVPVGEHKGAAIGFHQRPRFPLVCPRLLWPSLTRNVTVSSLLLR